MHSYGVIHYLLKETVFSDNEVHTKSKEYSKFSFCDTDLLLNDVSLACIHLKNTPLKPVKLDEFLLLPFSHNFKISKRQALYFGSEAYTYGNTIHLPKDISSINIIQDIYNKVNSLFDNEHFNFNSILVHLYPDLNSFLPFHSDDEVAIAANSLIVTVSLGVSREIVFEDTLKNKTYGVNLEHGDIFIMSKNSQDRFKHGINRDPSHP